MQISQERAEKVRQVKKLCCTGKIRFDLYRISNCETNGVEGTHRRYT